MKGIVSTIKKCFVSVVIVIAVTLTSVPVFAVDYAPPGTISDEELEAFEAYTPKVSKVVQKNGKIKITIKKYKGISKKYLEYCLTVFDAKTGKNLGVWSEPDGGNTFVFTTKELKKGKKYILRPWVLCCYNTIILDVPDDGTEDDDPVEEEWPEFKNALGKDKTITIKKNI